MADLLTEASVAFLLEHKDYRCSMASLTIRERLEVIEREARVAATSPSPAPELPLDVGAVEYAVHQAILAVPPMHVTNTDAVPQAKRRPNAVVDRHAVIVAAKAAVRDALAEYARLAADGATDEAERVWSQKLPK